MAGVTINRAVKEYGSTRALHGVSVDVADGEFVVLVGPSGCGKSTLLRMIAGLEEITDGTISIGGRVVNSLPPKRRDVSMVFQNYALYPHMTVAENMGFPMTLAGADAGEKRRRVAEAAEILGLTELLDRKPRQLSGGQRQRVAMGRSIVRDPQVFLFDEPLSNLDAQLRVQMREEVKALHRRLGTTVIYVTHDQVEAMTMADRIVVMRAGHVEQLGRPLELYDAPANAFVAQFIGSPSMNLIPTVVRDGVLHVEGTPSGIAAAPGLREGQRLFLGKRPEHVTIGEGPHRAEIRLLEPTGSEMLGRLRLGSETLSFVLRERPTFGEGDVVALSLSEGPTHLFDVESGQRI